MASPSAKAAQPLQSAAASVPAESAVAPVEKVEEVAGSHRRGLKLESLPAGLVTAAKESS